LADNVSSLRGRFVPLLAALGLFLAGCAEKDYPQSAIHPRSDYARWIQDLLELQVIWVVIIFVITMALLLYAVLRFRTRPGAPDPKPVHGNTVLEVAWTIAPAIILALVAIPTVVTIYKTQGAPPPNALKVTVIAHQWWWEFQYPELGIVTANEMHVPVGRTVAFDLKTADVIHSFWFPAAGGKRDAVPNRLHHMWFTPDSVGTYPGQCGEFCGLSHGNMRMKMMVRTPEEFEAWVAQQQAGPAEPDSASLAGQGKAFFMRSACIACHTVKGVSAGVLGPNLTHVGSRTSIAAGLFPNDTEHLGRWISDAPAMKPGALMLKMSLPPDQNAAIVAYLQSLK
jgi:cytochrome c oxidase subunit 2